MSESVSSMITKLTLARMTKKFLAYVLKFPKRSLNQLQNHSAAKRVVQVLFEGLPFDSLSGDSPETDSLSFVLFLTSTEDRSPDAPSGGQHLS